jgi:aconitate hydratase
VSFERIHRSNLIGMGIVPLLLPEGVTPAKLALHPGDRIEIDARAELIGPRARVEVQVHRRDRSIETMEATAAVETQLEAELLRYGGVIPTILRKTLSP